ncbi:MAG: hypothetical protein K1X35_13960 [Caulobacteraceae bacterium]|nr:hypothetical protein [Caulobacteraceae bacterium]
MKKLILPLFAAAALCAVAAPASADSWRSINERQRDLDARIDRGVRIGCLNRTEAARLRNEFQRIASLERQYRASGGVFTQFERQDLDRRMDVLSRDISRQCRDDDTRWDGHGGPGLPWTSINQRQRRLDERIDRGVRSGCLSTREAARLRTVFRDIAALESRYRRTNGGLEDWERRDLDRRFDLLGADIKRQCRDGDWR